MIDRRGARSVMVTVVSVLLVVGGARTVSAEPAPDEPPPDTAPAETAPAETTPSETPDTVPDGSGDDGSSGDFPWGILLGLGIGLVVVVALASWSSERSAQRRRAAISTGRQLDAVVSRSRWAVDHGVYAVLQAPDPATRASSWVALDAQLRSIEAEIGRAPGPFDPSVVQALARLGAAIAALRGTLAGGIQQRTGAGEPIAEATIAESVARATLARRNEVEAALRELEMVRF